MRVEEKQALKTLVGALEDGKAQDVVVLELSKLTTMTDFFVIAHGANSRQVQALERSVEEALRESCQLKPHHVEGLSAGQWVLMDYGFVIVHLFLEDRRSYYSLERIWMDAPRVEL